MKLNKTRSGLIVAQSGLNQTEIYQLVRCFVKLTNHTDRL